MNFIISKFETKFKIGKVPSQILSQVQNHSLTRFRRLYQKFNHEIKISQIQKESRGGDSTKGVLNKFQKIDRKTPVSKILFE